MVKRIYLTVSNAPSTRLHPNVPTVDVRSLVTAWKPTVSSSAVPTVPAKTASTNWKIILKWKGARHETQRDYDTQR